MDMSKILEKIPDKGMNGNGNYEKTKVYFTLEVGKKAGKEIRELKDLCRKNGKKIPNDVESLGLLYPKITPEINGIYENIAKIEEFLHK